MIEMRKVFFSYKAEDEIQVSDLNIEIKAGEFVLLCGKSGCGKTTILKMINGLIPHAIEGNYQGKVTIYNKSVREMETFEIAEKVGSIFQNPKTQFFNLDSDGELSFGLENMGIEPCLIKAKVQNTINELDIENLKNRNVFELSGGEKQILAVASVYATNPEIYVFDEPSANIDECGIDKIREMLIKLKEQGKTIIISEHRLYFLVDLIDKAIYLEDGKVKHIFSNTEFSLIDNKMRKGMGLRAFTKKDNIDFVIPIEFHKTDEFVISNLNYRNNHKCVLKNINISANKGDIIAITGKNGQGKTTLMKIICGLLKENAGTISYNGSLYKYKKRRTLCYMVMQDVIHQLFSESLMDEFTLFDSSVDKEQIDSILTKLELIKMKNRHPMCLSGGQMQRLAVAVGMLMNREIIILDEPTSGLDYLNMMQISEVIKEFSKNKIVFIVTHDKELIDNACNKLFEISDGEIYGFSERR